MSESKDPFPKSFYVFYASQSGKAQGIAERIASESADHGLIANIFCLSYVDQKFVIERVSCAVFVVSTFHNGAPPDTAVKFFRRISRRTHRRNFLDHLNYAILALGDSTHPRFCNFGKNLEAQFKKLSAQSIYPTGYADDSKGLENTTDAWIEGLWPVLCNHVCNNLQKAYEVNMWPYRPTPKDNKPVVHIEPAKVLEGLPDSFNISDLHVILKDCDVENLHLPRLVSSSFLLSYGDESQKVPFDTSSLTLAFKSSPVTKAKLISARKLTSREDVKETLELTFCFEDNQVSYVPGDAFGFICENPATEVDSLLERLNVADKADLPINLQLPEDSKKKLPLHIQQNISLRDVFLHCIEIRAVPKKVLLRILADFTTEKSEKDALLYLTSLQGTSVYMQCVFKPSLCLLDILMRYKSCNPPIEVLLEHLPSLKPRFYSVACSPLENETCFKIVFNVMKFPASDGRMLDRKGVCTGLFENKAEKLSRSESENVTDLTERISELKIDSNMLNFNIYKRQNLHFTLPDDLSCPIIMVGPGTGISPFVGFLQHRERLVKQTPDVRVGDAWLFYGCRFYEKDFLYKTELERLKSAGILTHLMVSLSRDPNPPLFVTTKYVHQSIKQHAVKLVAAIKCGARIYICGDAKNMAVDVQQAFIDAFKIAGAHETEAKSFVRTLQKELKYLNDVWA